VAVMVCKNGNDCGVCGSKKLKYLCGLQPNMELLVVFVAWIPCGVCGTGSVCAVYGQQKWKCVVGFLKQFVVLWPWVCGLGFPASEKRKARSFFGR